MAVTLFYLVLYHDYAHEIALRSALADPLFQPTFLFKLLHAPLGWGFDANGVWAYRPDGR